VGRGSLSASVIFACSAIGLPLVGGTFAKMIVRGLILDRNT
jgi:hypothetical protein